MNPHNKDTEPDEPLNNWPRHTHHPDTPVNERGRLTNTLKLLRLLLLTLAVFAAVLSFAAALAGLARP
ncbi:hypothetical protein AR457_32635 [Streptomyces agglomeratus]|uniref:Uncharacterized protein n=1 Tax=Streptomyces agglomeratus TaxID=285458 RepID=A0A1E5PG27_9ACTN|nr:hypothetical protein [Streptomyces agglomeratus]OEJ28508.1 hypothetical protein AS594_32545 [Streptomyces agglomeratus]OEJ48187.1 hypothetical protein AR457_32635 [Streptomyces agglomeratus]OEJ49969.1 hypothetical protein BGK72_03520 [Streptomyces agglomeratus]OEJ57297.1 hypothetical protein BGM19_04210 [Streptomyces agglomeratus]